MTTIRFTADIREDQTIHPPAGVRLAPGKAEVVVFQSSDPSKDSMREDPVSAAAIPDIAEDLALFAAQHDAQGVPSDLAMNHDHYVHGAPRGTDES